MRILSGFISEGELAAFGLDKAGRRALDFYLSEDGSVKGVSGRLTGAGLPDLGFEGFGDNLPAAQRTVAGFEYNGGGVQQRQGFALAPILARFARVGSCSDGGILSGLFGFDDGFGDKFLQTLGIPNPNDFASFETLAFPSAIGMFVCDFHLGKIVSDLNQVNSVDFYFVFLHGSVSFPACASRRCGAGGEGPLHNGLDFPDCQAVEIFIFVMPGFQSSDVQFFTNDTFKNMCHLCGAHCGFVLSGSVGQHLQLAQVIVNHGVAARVPVEMFSAV